MSDSESALAFSLPATVKFLVVGLSIGALGWAMIHTSVSLMWVLGACGLLAGPAIVLAVLAGGVRAGSCPHCGWRIEVFPFYRGEQLCEACTDYLAVDGNTLRPLNEAVEADHTFKLRLPWWDDLGSPFGSTVTIGGAQDYVQDQVQELLLTRRIPDRTHSLAWPAECSVCGAAATRFEGLAQQVNVGRGVRDGKLGIRVQGIPHCDRHEGGVRFSPSSGECGRVLVFRSLGFRNAVRRANWLEYPPGWRAGIDPLLPVRPGFVLADEEELESRGQAIVAARFCGPLLLLPYLYQVLTGTPVVLGWGLIWPAVAIGLVLWGYLTPLPTQPHPRYG